MKQSNQFKDFLFAGMRSIKNERKICFDVRKKCSVVYPKEEQEFVRLILAIPPTQVSVGRLF